MKILQVCPRNYQTVGGVESVVQKLAEGMKNRGHDVTVLCGNSSAEKVETEMINGIEVFSVPTFSPRNAFHIPRSKSVVKKLLGEEFDIVHTHSVHAVITMMPLDSQRFTDSMWRLVCTMHFSTPGYTFFRRLLWKLFWRRRINLGLRYVDAVHTTSMLESKIITELFSNAKGKLTLIRIGLDDDVFRYSWKGKDSDYILYCGRIEKYKRVDLAVRAVEYARGQGYNAKFVIVGDGSRSDYFRKTLENIEWITYMQPIPRKEYLELLSNARAVINLSPAENFNIFLAEACAIGVPIVATPEAAAFCPEFANVRGLKPSEIASVIANAMSQPETSIFPKECAPEPWMNVIKRFESFYQTILDRKGDD